MYISFIRNFQIIFQRGCESCSVMSESLGSHGLQPARLLCPWNSPGRDTGEDSSSLLQGIFATQELNPHLLHCRQILYSLSHEGSPEYWSVQPISSPADLPNPGIKLGSPALQADSLPAELIPSTTQKGSHCSASQSTLGIVNIFHFSHFPRYVLVSHEFLICVSVMTKDVEHL